MLILSSVKLFGKSLFFFKWWSILGLDISSGLGIEKLLILKVDSYEQVKGGKDL